MSRASSVVVLSAAVLVLSAGAPLSAPAPFYPGPRRDPEEAEWQRLRGTWVITRHESNGKPQRSLLIDQDAELSRDNFCLGYPQMTCRLRPGDRPRRFDARSEATKDWPEETVVRGIYKLEGNVLTLCFYAAAIPAGGDAKVRDKVREAVAGLEAPDGFDTTRSGATLLVLKRIGR